MDTAAAHSEVIQFVTFKLAGQKYAVDILKVQEIENMREITTIPNAPAYLEGAVNLRGKVIPVINLRKKFSFGDHDGKDRSKIVILDIGGVIMGAMVDSVSDVIRVSSGVVEPPPSVSSNGNSRFITGIAKLSEGLVIILDVDRLFGDEMN
jgi:purine-binding chemotaxis protein CheW